MAHLVCPILGGLYRGAWWRLSLFRLRSLGTILCVYIRVSRYAKSNRRYTPFELATLLIRFIRDGALEDRAEERESPRTVVQVFIAHARPLQDIVYDLHAVVGTRVSLWICGEAKVINRPQVKSVQLRSVCHARTQV